MTDSIAWGPDDDERLREKLEAESAETLLTNEKEARAAFISACEKTGTAPNMEAWEAVMNHWPKRPGSRFRTATINDRPVTHMRRGRNLLQVAIGPTP